MPTTFGERFCRARKITADRYENEVLKRTLYPMARVLRLVLALKYDYFAPDRDFVRGVARLSREADFIMEAWEYQHHPANRGFLRDRMCLRISVRRMNALVQRTLNADERIQGKG